MKKLLILILTFLMSICAFCLTACFADLSHKHNFDKKIATENYIVSKATCTQKAKYYYSCSCGEKGTETFENGELEGHSYTILKHDELEHWYECECGAQNGKESHKGGTATYTEKAKCVVCETEYGELEKPATEGLVFSLINNDTEYSVTDYIQELAQMYIFLVHIMTNPSQV